jgi:NADPH-dependent 2,4-dienoyl-CoA reductase/sulfur reductase-like enzyme
MEHIVIIGNGIAGITAARHIRKMSDSQITVISSETQYFYSRTALMYVYMGHMTFEHTKPYEDFFWKKNRIDLIFAQATGFDPAARTVTLQSGKTLTYDKLIIATGSRSNGLRIPGENLQNVQTLYSYQDLQKMEANTRGIKEAVVVGGGLIGVEMAEMLRSRHVRVTMIVREAAFWNNVLPIQEAEMISRHITSHGVEIRHNCELAEVIADSRGAVKAIRTSDNETLPAAFVGITVGVQPNVAWLENSPIDLGRGILVNEYLETNVENVYAIGDCVERRHSLEGRKNIEQVWYTARMMGETVARTVCGERTPYAPGPWFNSAKFFDIEFQTYGNVANTPDASRDDLYWEHASGRKAVHMVWDKATDVFIGINSFGIRLRHELFDRWLREKRSIRFVVEHLAMANFDPEFSDRHEAEIRNRFSEKQLIVN